MLAPLRMGILEVGTQKARAAVAPFFDALSRRSGHVVEPWWFVTYDDLIAQAPRLDLAWTPPLAAITLENRGVAKAIVACGRRGGVHYQAAFVVRQTSSIERVADLRGRRVAWVSRSSAAGYAVPRLFLQIEGLDPATMWKSEVFTGSHEAALAALVAREVDVAAVYVAPRLDGSVRMPGPSDGLRVLRAIGPIPSDVITARVGLDGGVLAALRGALLSMGEADLATLAPISQIAAFEPVPVSHLEPLAKLARLVRDSGRVA